jgi:hypothetical protein
MDEFEIPNDPCDCGVSGCDRSVYLCGWYADGPEVMEG